MPVSWAPERRRAKLELQNRMREQRQMGRVRREESARDDHANYMQNRRNAADAIGSQYGDAGRRAYLQNRTAGGVYGREASNASAQGMRTAQYIGQRNAMANDAAQRYAVERTADAAYLSGQGYYAAGRAAMQSAQNEIPIYTMQRDAAQYQADQQAGLERERLAAYAPTQQAEVDAIREQIRRSQADDARFGMPVGQRGVYTGQGGVYQDQVAEPPKVQRINTGDGRQALVDERGNVIYEAPNEALDQLMAAYASQYPREEGETQEAYEARLYWKYLQDAQGD